MSLKILIADDDLDDLELLEESILASRPDAQINKATGGAVAIKLLDSFSDAGLPQLIVLDYNMPDVTGLELLAWLKAMPRFDQIPRVVFSTSGAERHVSESIKNGATQYMVKPMTKRELDELASKMLALIDAK